MRPSHQQVIFFTGLCAIYLLSFAMLSTTVFQADLSWLMFETQRLLAGGSYSQNFFETNPPLILYFYIPPVLMVKWLGISKMMAMHSYIFLLGSGMLYLSFVLAKKLFADKDVNFTYLLIITLAVIFFIVPLEDFGQRDDLAILFSMPYLLLVVCRLENRAVFPRLAILIGMFAGLGFALKPYFLFTPTLIELYCIFYTRRLTAWRRPEVICMGLVFALYGSLIFFKHPDYVFLVAPLVLRVYYAGFGEPWRAVALVYTVLFCYFTGLFYLLLCRRGQYAILNRVLLIAYISFLMSYLSQQTAWYSHLLPILSFSILLLVLGFGQFITQKKLAKKHYLVATGLAILACFFLMHFVSTIQLSLFLFPTFFYAYFAVLCATLLYCAQPQKNSLTLAASVFFIIATGIGFSYMLQRTEWSAHGFSLTVLLLTLMLSLFIFRTSRSKHHHLFSALFAIVVFAFPYYLLSFRYQAAHQKVQVYSKLNDFMQTYMRHKTLYTFALVGSFTFPEVDFTATSPTLRMEFFFWVPALIHADTPQKKLDKRFFINMVAVDLKRAHPDFVFVDVSHHREYIHDSTFSFVRYFSQNAAFRAEWGAYRHFATIQNSNLFGSEIYKIEVYRRHESTT